MADFEGSKSTLKKFVVPLALSHPSNDDSLQTIRRADDDLVGDKKSTDEMEKVSGRLDLLSIKVEGTSPPLSQEPELLNFEAKTGSAFAVESIISKASNDNTILDSEISTRTQETQGCEDIPTESTLSTIDAANLGLQFWKADELEVETTPAVPANQPKKRGRKPKHYNAMEKKLAETLSTTVDEHPGTSNKSALDNTSGHLSVTSNKSCQMRFPQSIINGIISIDMSSIGIGFCPSALNAQIVPVDEPTMAKGEVEVEKKGKRSQGKKAEAVSKPKRGRPKRPKQDVSSSPTASPAKKTAKRGRKMRDSLPPQGIWTAKQVLDYRPEDYRKFEPVEILILENTNGFEHAKVFNFDESEFNQSPDDLPLWWPSTSLFGH